ncbi:hypothetical protein JUGLONE_236 [Bacillus phage Juglone]|uniref:Uncharacterized protein n=1 Tax=Bacillus phage Juglone TaxID=1805949 RepID=A0A143FIZ3_9CAUD|nr:hypothetical protein JUGLONE_236 [Bacillus phage Juglone]
MKLTDRELYLNQSAVTPLGKTQVTSVDITFITYTKEQVLDRIDRFVDVFTMNSEFLGLTDVKHWLTDYDVTKGEQ